MPHSFPLLNRIASRATTSPSSPAIIIPSSTFSSPSTTYTYSHLYSDILLFSHHLESHTTTPGDLNNTRVALLLSKSYPLIPALLGTYTAGGLALPLLPALPLPEHEYMIRDSGARVLVCDEENRGRGEELVGIMREGKGEGEGEGGVVMVMVEDVGLGKRADGEEVGKEVIEKMDAFAGDRKAMMLYTSGTTGRPKGVVTRHSALTAQVSDIVEYWQWRSDDLLLHTLPLNHLHGIVVALLTSLYAGAAVELWKKFDAEGVWRRFINENEEGKETGERGVTLMFGVPTVYSRLIQTYKSFPPSLQQRASQASSKLRLQVSGSAPLPAHVKEQWDGGIGGGQVLLERYGMTETGIILSTGFDVSKRILGHVGSPLPSIQIRLFSSETNTPIPPDALETEGEIQVRGPGIFNEYWGLPEKTKEEFVNAEEGDEDGGDWFRTGDTGVRSGRGEGEGEGMFRILGRTSVDIIKSGGEKLSAVEVERDIMSLGYVDDVAVVGLPDDEWGQIIGAVLVTSKKDLTLDQLRKELRSKMAAYKLPRALKIYDEIPRNAMGKVQKKQLVATAFSA